MTQKIPKDACLASYHELIIISNFFLPFLLRVIDLHVEETGDAGTINKSSYEENRKLHSTTTHHLAPLAGQAMMKPRMNAGGCSTRVLAPAPGSTENLGKRKEKKGGKLKR